MNADGSELRGGIWKGDCSIDIPKGKWIREGWMDCLTEYSLGVEGRWRN